jgi:hypothetical protein
MQLWQAYKTTYVDICIYVPMKTEAKKVHMYFLFTYSAWPDWANFRRLGEFSPVGRVLTLASVLKTIPEVAQMFELHMYVFHSPGYVLILTVN